MVVDGGKHTNDLILLPHRVIPDWWRDQGHRLSTGDLDQVPWPKSPSIPSG